MGKKKSRTEKKIKTNDSLIFENIFSYFLDIHCDDSIKLDIRQRPIIAQSQNYSGKETLQVLKPILHSHQKKKKKKNKLVRDVHLFEILPKSLKEEDYISNDPSNNGEYFIDNSSSIICYDSWLNCEQDNLSDQHFIEYKNYIPETLKLFTKVLHESRDCVNKQRNSESAERLLSSLISKLNSFATDAHKPLILTTKERLSKYITILYTRLTKQLRREHKLIHLGKVDEVDSYCIRHLIRRPGLTIPEKAGPEQKVMAIHRKESFDTGENRFLKMFLILLFRESQRYLAQDQAQFINEIKEFNYILNRFLNDKLSMVKSLVGVIKPNNVLRQRHDYRTVFQSYQDYIRHRKEMLKLWSGRVSTFADYIFILLCVALYRISGVQRVFSLENISEISDFGSFLQQGTSTKIQLAYTQYYFSIELVRNQRLLQDGDISIKLKWEKIDIPLDEEIIGETVIPIWVFWGELSRKTCLDAQNYLRSKEINPKAEHGFIISLLEKDNERQSISKKDEKNITLVNLFINSKSYKVDHTKQAEDFIEMMFAYIKKLMTGVS